MGYAFISVDLNDVFAAVDVVFILFNVVDVFSYDVGNLSAV